jgi:hypothetical protein
VTKDDFWDLMNKGKIGRVNIKERSHINNDELFSLFVPLVSLCSTCQREKV